MFHWIMEFLAQHHSFNDLFALFLFYIPLVCNGITYFFRIIYRVQLDKDALAESKTYYDDWLRMRHVVGYLAMTVLPVVNLIAFVFDTLGSIWKWLLKRFSKFFEFRFVGSDKKS